MVLCAELSHLFNEVNDVVVGVKRVVTVTWVSFGCMYVLII